MQSMRLLRVHDQREERGVASGADREPGAGAADGLPSDSEIGRSCLCGPYLRHTAGILTITPVEQGGSRDEALRAGTFPPIQTLYFRVI